MTTIMTTGIASPFLIAGMGAGVAGAVTNLGTSIVEAFLNSTEIRKAERNLRKTLDYMNNVRNTVQKWRDTKEVARLLWISYIDISLNRFEMVQRQQGRLEQRQQDELVLRQLVM